MLTHGEIEAALNEVRREAFRECVDADRERFAEKVRAWRSVLPATLARGLCAQRTMDPTPCAWRD